MEKLREPARLIADRIEALVTYEGEGKGEIGADAA